MNESIGITAGLIWQTLDKNGQMSISELIEKTGLSAQELLLAIGWLSRENKILHFKTEEDDWMLQLIY